MLQLAIMPQPVTDVFNAVLTFWYDVCGSWGMAIILLTFTVRLLILPLTFKSVKGMQTLQVLQPEMTKIRERYKDDRTRMNEEIMKFYKERQVNPFASCIPILFQIPFFLALFDLLRSDEFERDIEGEESFLFIPNLADKLTGEPLILVFMIALYVVTQLVAGMITMVSGDKNQRIMMFALPLVIAPIIPSFEAGLIVYWITTNVWTIGQQLLVRKLYPRPDLEAAQAEADAEDKPRPARGKPRAEAAAVADDGKPKSKARAGAGAEARSKGDADTKARGAAAKPKRGEKPKAGTKSKSGAKAGGDAANGARAKPPPASPRKKKKRSGRRR